MKLSIKYIFPNESHLMQGGIVKGIIYQNDETKAWTLECVLCHNGLHPMIDRNKPQKYVHGPNCPNKDLF